MLSPSRYISAVTDEGREKRARTEMKRTFNLQELARQICGDAAGIGNKSRPVAAHPSLSFQTTLLRSKLCLNENAGARLRGWKKVEKLHRAI